ncbi:TIGR03621 family F420-dependent LLM class oxidoreductase [Amycolatopsis suaedae]|uniref:TIGR03621 family F420-dependent LLM class oxidoreductase n=1 Tax=Amycolatopsis suaedae TaxID=2510978 RepID=A0A4Q7JCM9_9PSEU|nr:TIGR03621 family F420-dependent LLM class oxidoreductase [Amycolatopsis suaedae]RZQ65089.1 TIGR03621 family F420-dependent LLM class oxidoreductase [Amycolatopsis suaedae]
MTLPRERPFRFGVVLLAPATRAEWIAACRRAEELGYDVVSAADHLGRPAPFPALVLAAEATERIRLGTCVINTAFYNPTLLARDIATTDQFTGGRLELGLGAGYVKAEFDAAGIEWQRAGKRVDHLEHTIEVLDRLFADERVQPRPARRPPLMLAGNGDRMLGLAARHADVVGFTGAPIPADGELPSLARSEAVAERVAYVTGLLGERISEVEFNILVQKVLPEGAEEVRDVWGGPVHASDAELLDVPTLLIGSPAEKAEILRRRRETFGFSYVTVLGDAMEEFAEVISELR